MTLSSSNPLFVIIILNPSAFLKLRFETIIGSHSFIASSIFRIDAGPSSIKLSSFGYKSPCSKAKPSEYKGFNVGQLQV